MKRSFRFAMFPILFALLASCGAQEGGSTPVVPETDAGSVTQAETEEVRTPYLVSEDYGNAPFHILTMTTTGIYWFSDGENGDTLNDGVYRRNAMTEEYLGVDISWEAECDYSELPSILRQSVMAGDDAYQMVLSDSMRGNTDLVSSGLLLDLRTVSSIDFSHEYWNQSALDALTVFDHVYFAKSSYTLPAVAVVTFNKGILSELDYEDPYTLVREDRWNLDIFTEMIRGAAADINGDSVMDKNDRFGMTCMMDYPVDCFIYAAGLSLTQLKDGKMELSLYGDRALSLYEKLNALLNESKATYHWDWGSKDNPEKTVAMSSGRTLFELNRTDSLYQLRGCTVDFGIVPYPKLDNTQKNYTMNDYSRLICVPSAASDPEMVGKVLEMLGYYSTEYVYPAYYNDLMNTKVVRDAESIEMLDIVFNNVVCDGGMSYFGLNGKGIEAMMYYVSRTLSKGKNDFASFYAKNETKAQQELDKFYESIGAEG